MILRHILTALAVAASFVAAAQTPGDSISAGNIIKQVTAPGLIEIYYPAGLDTRLEPVVVEEQHQAEPAAPSIQSNTRVGYRVQVFDDNNVNTAKHDAQSRSMQLQSRFPEWRTYIQFNSPYWRVKVGDFKTRSEAEAAMSSIRSAFPAMGSQLRVVRDRINAQ